MIEKLLIPNRTKEIHRKFVNYGALIKADVPPNIVEYFPARDMDDYGADIERVINESRAEGFAFTDDVAELWRYQINEEIGPSHMKWICVRWTWAMMLFDIIHNRPHDNYTMIMIDDWYLKLGWWDVCHIFYSCWNDRFGATPTIIQLNPVWMLGQPIATKSPVDGVGILVRGLSGIGDAGLILNRQGAQIIFDKLCQQAGDNNVETIIGNLAHEDDQTGFYSISKKDFVMTTFTIPPHVHIVEENVPPVESKSQPTTESSDSTIPTFTVKE